MPIQDAGEMRAGEAKPGGRFGNAHYTEIVAQYFAGMCGIEDHCFPLLSVVVQVIDENHVDLLECERNSPIAAYPDGPVIFEAPAKRMQIISWRVHISCHGSHIQGRKKLAPSCSVLWADS